VREKKGISRHELATLASLSDEEIEVIETRVDYVPSLRSVIYLADALELSRDRLKELAGLIARTSADTQQSSEYRFAASSNPIDSISDEHYEAIRALVEVLSEKK
jgi:transcriptional regulator with XRE-family HTH domain